MWIEVRSASLPITIRPQATAPSRKVARQTRAKRHSRGRGGPRRQAKAIASGPSSSRPSAGIRLKKLTLRQAVTTASNSPLSSAVLTPSNAVLPPNIVTKFCPFQWIARGRPASP